VEVVEMTMQSETNRTDGAHDEMDQASPFSRMLVAIDGSEAAQGAFDLARDWAGQHGSAVWFVQLTEERRQHRSTCESDVDPMTVAPANHVVVRGPTQGARNRQLVHGIAEAAAAFEADVIVLGFDQRRLAHHRVAPSLREQVTRAVDLPVLVAPIRQPEQPGAKPHLRVLPEPDGAGERTHSKVRRYAHV
jgi:nucleotide-binding universal stress UspA family protein